MSVSIKVSYKNSDNQVCDASTKKIVIINEIISYLTIFKTNGNNLLQKLDLIIQEIRQIPRQSLTPTALSILEWILKHVGLVENLSNFFNNSINELIEQFTALSSTINTNFQKMKTDLDKEKKSFDSAVDDFSKTRQIQTTLREKLRDIEEKVEQLKKDNSPKVGKQEAEFAKLEKEYINAEKNAFEKRTTAYNSKLQFAAEEEQFVVKWEELDSQTYQEIENILKNYSIKVQQISKELKDLSQESHKNTLKAIQDECIKTSENKEIDNFNYEDTFRKLNRKYGYDETLPKLEFNVFKFMSPQEVFKDELKGTYFIVKRKFKIKKLDEIEAIVGTILKMISSNEDGTKTVRNEENGEIGVISDKNIEPISEDIKIIRQIRKLNNSTNDDPIYVLAMSEADPETHLVKCMDADGAITMLNDQMLDPPLQ